MQRITEQRVIRTADSRSSDGNWGAAYEDANEVLHHVMNGEWDVRDCDEWLRKRITESNAEYRRRLAKRFVVMCESLHIEATLALDNMASEPVDSAPVISAPTASTSGEVRGAESYNVAVLDCMQEVCSSVEGYCGENGCRL